MDIGISQNINQSQNLVLTFRMQQRLKTLQMSNLELRESIYNEVNENPVLEVISDNPYEHLDNFYEKYDYNTNYEEYNSSTNTNYESYNNPINYIMTAKTLKDFLYEQIGYLKESKEIITIMAYIIESLDDQGYFNIEIPFLCELLSVTKEVSEYALEKVQNLSPDGIASRDLKECLKFQLRKLNICDPHIFEIVDKYLELVAERKVKQIAINLNIKNSQTKDYIEIIKSLNPIPSRGFANDKYNNYIIPEATIERLDNNVLITMNKSVIPKIQISQFYKNLYGSAKDKESKSYLKDKMDSAGQLISAINERQKTVYKIIREIADIQKFYFLKGEEYLLPMKLSDISERLDMYESTISRGIRSKFIVTPYKTCLIKDLFTTGPTQNGNQISSKVIKKEIETIIKNENIEQPLSDQKICEILAHKNFNLSRRTLAKYRESLGIPASYLRKHENYC